MTEILTVLSRFAGRCAQSDDPAVRNAAVQLAGDIRRLQSGAKDGQIEPQRLKRAQNLIVALDRN